MKYNTVTNLKSKKKKKERENNSGKMNGGVTIACERLCFKGMHIFNSYLAGAKKNYQYSAYYICILLCLDG